MKYADSFEETVAHTAAGTKYSEWFDISWANELYVYCTVTFAETRGGGKDESLDTNKLERSTPDSVATEVVAFTVAKTATATEEEEYASVIPDGNAAVAAANKLGMRVRFKSITSGTTWTASQSISIAYTIYAKRN